MLQQLHDGIEQQVGPQHIKLGIHDAVQHVAPHIPPQHPLLLIFYSLYPLGSGAVLNLRDKLASALRFNSLILLLSVVSVQQFDSPPISVCIYVFIKKILIYYKNAIKIDLYSINS